MMQKPFWGIILLLSGGVMAMAGENHPRLPILANDEAWKRLPGAPEKPLPLPTWARMLAGPHPITTARMLELDALHRTGDRLDGRFRAIVRFAAADANRCEYGRAMAMADFARAGGSPNELAGLVKNADQLPEADRHAVPFARQMMIDASKVADAQVKKLIEVLGEERVMALVALLAHASFQDRIFLALNASPEMPSHPEAIGVRFGKPTPPKATSPPMPPKFDITAGKTAASETWLKLQANLEEQKRRPGRIKVPTEEQFTAKLGTSNPGTWQKHILWSRVAFGYQPELTEAWFDCSGNGFRFESKLTPLFTNSLFWVVTDALKCFY